MLESVGVTFSAVAGTSMAYLGPQSMLNNGLCGHLSRFCYMICTGLLRQSYSPPALSSVSKRNTYMTGTLCPSLKTHAERLAMNIMVGGFSLPSQSVMATSHTRLVIHSSWKLVGKRRLE